MEATSNQALRSTLSAFLSRSSVPKEPLPCHLYRVKCLNIRSFALTICGRRHCHSWRAPIAGMSSILRPTRGPACRHRRHHYHESKSAPWCLEMDENYQPVFASRPPHELLSNRHGFRTSFVQKVEFCFRKIIHCTDRRYEGGRCSGRQRSFDNVRRFHRLAKGVFATIPFQDSAASRLRLAACSLTLQRTDCMPRLLPQASWQGRT
jgi:hypothetical protein